jgi:hypothetical protein
MFHEKGLTLNELFLTFFNQTNFLNKLIRHFTCLENKINQKLL